MKTTSSSEQNQQENSNPREKSHQAENVREPFIPAWWRDGLVADLTGPELKVYAIYLSHKNADGLAWPSLGSLSKTTGLNICTAKIARRGLVKKGLLLPQKQDHARGRFGKKAFQVCTVGGKTTSSTVGGNTAVSNTALGGTTKEGSPGSKVLQYKGATVDAVRRPNDAELRPASEPEIHGGTFPPSTLPEEKPSDRKEKRFSPAKRKAKLSARLAAKARGGNNMFEGTLDDDQREAFSYIRYDRDDPSNLTNGFVWTVEDLYSEHRDQLPPPGILCSKIIDHCMSEIESYKKLDSPYSDPSEFYWPPDFQAHRDRLRAEERRAEERKKERVA